METNKYLTFSFPAAHGRSEWTLHGRYEGPTRCRLLLLPSGEACRTTRDLPSLPLLPHTEPRLHRTLHGLGPSCRQYQGSCCFRSTVITFKIDFIFQISGFDLLFELQRIYSIKNERLLEYVSCTKWQNWQLKKGCYFWPSLEVTESSLRSWFVYSQSILKKPKNKGWSIKSV